VINRIAAAVGAQRGLVVFDEAYEPFASRTWMQRMAMPEHLLVLRTLSKFRLAAVRIGYLSGRAEVVAEVDKVRPPYHVSVLNAEAAHFAAQADAPSSVRGRAAAPPRLRSGDLGAVDPMDHGHPEGYAQLLDR
jgi:histidinol-phosphate/aromatic aminotransferase/cobyric acid decarboxylase-like protein